MMTSDRPVRRFSRFDGDHGQPEGGGGGWQNKNKQRMVSLLGIHESSYSGLIYVLISSSSIVATTA